MFQKALVRGAVAAVLMALTLSGCNWFRGQDQTAGVSPSPERLLPDQQTPAAKQSTAKVGDMAKDVADGVGSVQKVVTTGELGPLFVFEEFHTSKVGRLQTAVMLLRLHDKYGLRKIGLEGGIYSGRRLDASWFHGMGGPGASSQRQDLSVRLLAEGEISPPEFMSLAFPDEETYGVETKGDYDVLPEKEEGKAVTEYLFAIAERGLSYADKVKVNSLVQQGSEEKAVEYMLSADPWVKKQYESLKSETTVSSEEMLDRLHAIQSKASEVGAEISPEARAGLQKEVEFYEAASRRSKTMVSNVLKLPGVGSGVPSALIVGAAHTDEVAKLLAASNVSFAVIRASDFNPKQGSLTDDQFERKSRGGWANNDAGTLGKALNAHNPPPVIDRTTGHSYASMNMAGMLLAQAARGGGPPLQPPNANTAAPPAGGDFPNNVWPLLASLPDITIDRDSITRDGYDVIFSARLKQDSGQEKVVWARVGTLSKAGGVQGTDIRTLEQRLLQAADDLKRADNTLPPDELPRDSKPADGEGPRDSKRKEVVITRTGRDTLAVYAAKHDDVMVVGRLSD
jgi:hypothetical protein